MIEYHFEERKKYEMVVDQTTCNCCGQQIEGDCLHIDKSWGYDSDYDFENHQFDLCLDCYNKLILSFKVPIDTTEVACAY